MSDAAAFLPFDLSDPEFKRNPYPAYARLRESHPILRSGSGAVFASSASAVGAISGDRRFGKAFRQLVERRYGEGAVGKERAFNTMDRWVLHANPPHHAKLRAPAVAAFAARRIEALRADVRLHADEVLSALPRGETVNIVDALSFAVPTRVICRLFGIPDAEREEVFRWSGVHGRFLDPAPPTRAFMDDANEQDALLSDYFADLCKRRAQEPKDDLISALVHGELMPPEDLVPNIIFMFGAGHETTVNTISNFIIAMAAYPDQRQLVADDPTLMKGAVEEILRYDSSVHTISRVALEPASIDGFEFLRGDLVYCLTAAANRDPAIHADPERFDVTRTPGPFFSFGGGIHYCLGAQLARLELAEAMGALLRHAPRFEIEDWDLRYRANFTLRGLDEIKVRL
jgi:cytochrome P450